MYLRYAKPYLPLAFSLTLISWWLVYDRGPAAISGAFFLKVFTVLIGFAVLRKLHRFDIFFYQNIGYGERQLLLVTAVADLFLWLTGVGIIVIVTS